MNKKMILTGMSFLLLLIFGTSVYAWTLYYSTGDEPSTFTKNDGTVLSYESYNLFCDLRVNQYTTHKWIEPTYGWVQVPWYNDILDQWQNQTEWQQITEGYYNDTFNCPILDYQQYINATILAELQNPSTTNNRDVNRTIDDNIVIDGNLYVHGVLSGASPLKLEGEVQFLGADYDGEVRIKEIFQKIKNKFLELKTQVDSNTADIQIIKDNGWTGTFTAGQTCTVNKGIITGCV